MKQNNILVILVVVLAAVVSWFIFTRSSSTLGGELRNFSVEDTAAVDKIFIADKEGNSSTLERVSSGKWTVNGKFAARQDAINTLLETVSRMTVRNPVPKALEPKVLRDLSGPIQKKVEIFSNGNLLKTMYVGNESMDKMGTFMLLEGSSVPFEVHLPGHRGYLQTRFIVPEDLWRDPAVFKYDYRDIRKVELRYRDKPEQSFQLGYDGLNFNLSGVSGSPVPGGLDTLRALRYLNEFRSLTWEFIVSPQFPASRKDSILSNTPFFTLSVTDKNNITRSVDAFHRVYNGPVSELLTVENQEFDVDRFYGLVDKKDFVLLQFYQFDRVLKTISWLQGKD
ncbi:MAG: DUF4340 domain-containing protein [Bacteroidetes bacterium]|nr:DUF4340 domain-containing protein [Bacteroidota bacterium]